MGVVKRVPAVLVTGSAADLATENLADEEIAFAVDTGDVRVGRAGGDNTTKFASATPAGAGTYVRYVEGQLLGPGDEVISAGGGSAPFVEDGAWTTGTAYAVNDVVTQNAARYVCRSAHTSGTFATDLAASRWVLLSDAPDSVNVKRVYALAGDTKQLRDVSTTSGSAVITSASANFTAADVGKTIRVESTTPVVTTIASRQSATQVTLAATVGSTQSNLYAHYGTDDTAKIQQAITDYSLAGTTAGRAVTLYFPAGCYMIAGALQDTTTWNAQIKLPYQSFDGTAPNTPWVLRLLGDGRVEGYALSGNPAPPMTGTIFFSPLAGSGSSPLPSMIRAGANNGTNSTGGFSTINVEVDGITFRTGNKSTMTALNLREADTARIGWARGVTIDSSVPTANLAPAATSAGLVLPWINNGACCQVGSLYISGYGLGLAHSEHLDGKSITIQSCLAALQTLNATTGAGSHSSHIDRLLVQWCPRAFTSVIGATGYLQVDMYNAEHATSGTFQFAYDVDDVQDYLVLTINAFRIVVAGTGADDSQFAVNGAKNTYALPLVSGNRYPTKTGNYTLTNGDLGIFFNGTSLTATLPNPAAATKAGRVYMVKNVNASPLTVVSAGTSKTIDGAASVTLPQWGVGRYITDGTNWFSV